MTFCITVWLFGAVLGYSADSINSVILWFRICSFGFIFLHAFTLHFCIVLTSAAKTLHSRALPLLLYVPSIIFMYMSARGLIVFREFIQTENAWLGVADYGSLSFTLLIINYVTYYVAAAYLLIRWRRRAETIRRKRQALVILVSILSTILLFNLEPITKRSSYHRYSVYFG